MSNYICEDCIHNDNGWCDEYNDSCDNCSSNCRRNGTILSGDDIESQDDFNAFMMM